MQKGKCAIVLFLGKGGRSLSGMGKPSYFGCGGEACI